MRAKLGDGVMACGNATRTLNTSGWAKNTPNAKWGMAVGKIRTTTRFLLSEAWGRVG